MKKTLLLFLTTINLIGFSFSGLSQSACDGTQRKQYGTSLNALDQATGHWHQTRMDKNGVVLRLAGGLESGNMTLTGSGLDQNGKPINHRIIWQPNSNGTIVQHWQFKHDGDSEWATLFRSTYSKL